MDEKEEIIYQYWEQAVKDHDFTQADKQYQLLVSLDSSIKGVNFPMGIWFKEKKLWDKANLALERALIVDSEIAADIYYNLGNIALGQKKDEEAIGYYQEALKVDPEFFEAYYNLGKAYGSSGQSEKALGAFMKAQELNPKDLDTLVNIGVELSNQNRRKEALKTYNKALKINPYSYLVYSNIGVEYTALGEYEKAMFYHKKALEFNSFYGDAWYNLACTYAQANDVEASLKALNKAIRLDKENITYAKQDPELDNVRDTLGYKNIVEKGKNLR